MKKRRRKRPRAKPWPRPAPPAVIMPRTLMQKVAYLLELQSKYQDLLSQLPEGESKWDLTKHMQETQMAMMDVDIRWLHRECANLKKKILPPATRGTLGDQEDYDS
jgi:hypothetical protein